MLQNKCAPSKFLWQRRSQQFVFRRRMFYFIFKITPPPSHPFKCRVQIRESNWTVTMSMFSLNFKITPSLRSHSTLLTSVQIIGVVNWVGVVAFDVWSYGIRRPNIKPLGWLIFWQDLLYMSRMRCTLHRKSVAL